MMFFVQELKRRNTLLFWFGVIHFIMALASLFIIAISDVYIMGVPAFLVQFNGDCDYSTIFASIYVTFVLALLLWALNGLPLWSLHD